MVLEGGWLLAVVLITLYFNIYTKDSRIFEPQKALFLRFLVTVMLAVWAVRTLEENREKIQERGWWWKALTVVAVVSLVLTVVLLVVGLSTWKDPLADMAGAGTVEPTLLALAQLGEAVATFLILFGVGLALVGAGYAMRSSWKQALRTAMVIPALAYVGVHIVSTIASVFPQASLYGGYVRQQGTLTVMAYIGLFFLLAFNLRRKEQVDRLITVILVTSIPATLYGIVQKIGIDPLPWMGNVEARVASTMGNAIFIAAYLIMVLPFTGYRLLQAWDNLVKSRPPEKTPPQKSAILKLIYPILLGIGALLIVVIIFLAVPIGNMSEAARIAQDTTLTLEAQTLQTEALWTGYGNGVILFLGVALLTVALPALVYTIISLIWDRARPYAHLVALGIVFVEAVLVIAAASIFSFPDAIEKFLESARVSGFFWTGYLLGLLGLALLSRWQHHRQPWGSDALWTDAVYMILVTQSIFLFAVIQAYLPKQPYPSDWWLYLAALVVFFGACYVVAAGRIVGRTGYLVQLVGYTILILLQLLCIYLTQSRGPLIGLLAGLVVFALVTLLVVARNARRSEDEPAPSLLRVLHISGAEVGRAIAFALLLLLNVSSLGLLAWGLWRAHPLFLVLGGVGLFIAWIIAAIVLFGPGLPRSVGKWLLAALAVVAGGVGLLVAMVTVERGRRWLWLGVLLPMIVLAIGLLLFNLPDTPVLGDLVMSNPTMASLVDNYIVPAKSTPYIGRLGRLTDASSGTGRVRRLIWFGDDIGAGSVGMILHNPLRTLIGYGPETMHVAYNPYYPPDLAHVEKRNASPDRAHNAIIDELVTLGALGLAVYFFYFLALFVLLWQLLRKAHDSHSQMLLVGLFSIGAAHFAETLFGIPIVSTRMYLWIAIGIAVALTFMPPFSAEEVAQPEEKTAPTPERMRRRRRAERFRYQRGIPAGWYVVYAAVVLAAIIFTARVDFKPMQADLLFWQSEQMKAQAKAYQDRASSVSDPTQQQRILSLANDFANRSLEALHEAISVMPQEDFYYLSLAQTYLNSAASTPAAQNPPVASDPCSAYRDQDIFFQSTELAIERARDLSSLNTDHYRNFAAMHMAWFQATQRRPAECLKPHELTLSIAYGEQALSLTRNNADLHNRQAQAYLVAAAAYSPAMQAEIKPKALAWLQNWEQYHLTSGGRAGDTHLPLVDQYRREAAELLETGQDVRGLEVLAAAELQYSFFLDDEFSDTFLAMGDLYWKAFHMPTEAALTYAQGIGVKHTLISDSQFDARLNYLSQTVMLGPILQSYQAVATADEANLQNVQTATANQQATWHRQASDVYQLMGYIYSKYLKDPANAMHAYESALVHGETFDSHHNLAMLYAQAGRLAEALAQGQAALPLAKQQNQKTQLQNLLIYIGKQAFDTSQYDTAEGAYQAVLQADPQRFEAHYNLAVLYEKQNRLSEALSQAEAALQVATEDQKATVQALVDALKTALGATP
jgi:tetratricopeptide (TPR) repeat protein